MAGFPAGPREHALTPAERPAARRRVVRGARLVIGDSRVTVRLPGAVHEWPVGTAGIASAVHARNPCPLAGVREKGGQGYWQQAAVQHIEDSGGCLHLCNADGESLACLLPNDWVPDGIAPVPLGKAGQPRRGAGRRPEDYLRAAGIAGLFAEHGIPVRSRPVPPGWAEGAAGTLRPGPYEAVSWKTSCALWAVLLAGAVAPFAGFLAGRARDSATPLVVGCTVFAVLLLLLSVAAWALPALRAVLAPSPGPASDSLGPCPGVPVTRGFLRRARLVRYGDELMLRDAHGTERWLRGPEDSVSGIRSAVVRTSAAEPWAVALVDRNDTVRALLPWETWCAGDGGAERLERFCGAAGIPLRWQAGHGAPRDFRDTDALPWTGRDYARNTGRFAQLTFCAAFGTFAAVLVLSGLALASPALVAVSVAAAAAGFGAPAVRLLTRRLWLNQLVRPRAPLPRAVAEPSRSAKRK